MKLVSFRWRDKDSYGVVADGGVIDLGPRLGARYPDLKSVLAAGALGATPAGPCTAPTARS